MRRSETLLVRLPDHYRQEDFFAFHRRDAEQLAERVGDSFLEKGVLWDGAPALLSFRLDAKGAHVGLASDASDTISGPALEKLAQRMLGLTQPIEKFEDAWRNHPDVGRMIARNPGLRLPLAATPFEALSWAIIGQQITVSAAVSLRRRMIVAAGIRHSSGFYCYPDAAAFLRLTPEDLRGAGFSAGKIGATLTLAEQIQSETLSLDRWLEECPAAEISEALLKIKGIGPWTVNYALLRGFGHLDGSLEGDAAVRRNMQALLGRADKLSQAEAKRWLEPFSPWRALVGAHLWAWKEAKAY